MKINNLIIHNIASFNDANINFNTQPLKNCELFLISGKTGAGKSTILDAICLALYNKTPRYENTQTKEEINTKLKTNDIRQILRSGTVEGFIELNITGNNNIPYLIKWELHRSNKKITGDIQSVKWSLTNLNTNITFLKVGEIEKEIQVIVGLTFNQFCRTTILPQGEFTKFLDSKNEEKAEILEKITGVEKYTLIGKKIGEKASQKKVSLDQLKAQISSIEIFSNEDIQNKKEEIKRKTQEIKQAETIVTNLNQSINWVNEYKKLCLDLNQAGQELYTYKQQLNSEAYINQNNILTNLAISQDVRNHLNIVNNARGAINTYMQEMNSYANNYVAILNYKYNITNELEKQKQNLIQIEQLLNHQGQKQDCYNQKDSILNNLQLIIQAYSDINNNKQQITILDNEINAIVAQENNAQTQIKIKEDAIQKTIAKQQHIEAELNKTNIQQHLQNKDAYTQYINNLNLLKASLKSIQNIESNTKTLHNSILQLQNNIVDIENAIPLYIKEEKAAHKIFDEYSNLVKFQANSINTFAEQMRSTFNIGCTCPVCLQVVQNLPPINEELQKSYKQNSTLLKSAEKEWNNIKNTLNKALTEKDSKSQELERLINLETININNIHSNIDQSKQLIQLTNSYNIVDFNQINQSIINIDTIINNTNNTIYCIEQDINTYQANNQQYKNLIKDIEVLKKEKEDLILQNNNFINNKANKIGQKNTLETHIKTKQEQINNYKTALYTQITGTWQTDWTRNPKAFYDEFSNDYAKYLNNINNKSIVTNNIANIDSTLKQIQTNIDNILNINKDWYSIITPKQTINNIDQNFLDKAYTYATNTYNTIYSKHQQIIAENKKIQDEEAFITCFINNNHGWDINTLNYLNSLSINTIEEYKKNIETINSNIVSLESKHEAYNTALNKHIQGVGNQELINNTDNAYNKLSEQLLNIKGQINDINKQIGSLQTELKIDNENKIKYDSLIKEINAAQEDYEQWNNLRLYFGQNDGAQFRKIAQSFILAQLIHSANHYMQTLSDRYELKVKPGTFLITLTDAYQGYIERSVQTISGGEKFLVSLSLALALSDIGQDLKVDMLFIDEGFGTLSGDALNKAIITLKNLRGATGRRVGLISHIEELKEKIPVQIKIEQGYNSSSSTINIIG